MPLTQEQIEQFNEQGFLPCPNLLTALEVAALHQRLEDIGNQVVDFPEQYVQIEPRVASGELKADPVRFKDMEPDPPRSALQGAGAPPENPRRRPKPLGPDLKIYVDQTLCKPPRVG